MSAVIADYGLYSIRYNTHATRCTSTVSLTSTIACVFAQKMTSHTDKMTSCLIPTDYTCLISLYFYSVYVHT